MAAFGSYSAPKPGGLGKPQDGDIEFPSPPSDSMSCLALNGSQAEPTSIVCVGAWDNSVRCYQLSNNGNQVAINPQSEIKHDAPVLCSDFSSDNVTNFSAGCDGQVRMWNVTQGPQGVQVIGKHDQPVSCMKWLPALNVLATGSWDKTIRLWDCRQPNAAATMSMNDKVYTMDGGGKVLVCVTADNQISAWPDLPSENRFVYKSPLTYQARSISMFADCEGFAVGCIEGRVAIEYFSEVQQKAQNPSGKLQSPRSFVFKCHRDASSHNIYSVNAIHFHPRYNTFLTAGGDGTIIWWDKDARARLVARDKFKGTSPVVTAKFSPHGDALFYILSYDWSQGAEGYPKNSKNALMYHKVNPQDIEPKPKKNR